MPNSVGIVPVKVLLTKATNCNFGILAISVGIVPVSAPLISWRVVRLGTTASSLIGIGPDKTLPTMPSDSGEREMGSVRAVIGAERSKKQLTYASLGAIA